MANPQVPLPRSADITNPLYYLENIETVVGWVRAHHSDLLTLDEVRCLDRFLALPVSPRALLTRMVMRTGDLFRADRLHYPELPDPTADALHQLIDEGWLEPTPSVTLDDLFRLYTLAELRPAFADGLAALGQTRALTKRQLQACLAAQNRPPAPVADWSPALPGAVVRLKTMALFDRIRLMFFGNLRQSWSDFVLVELGHQRYESVRFSSEARAFQNRQEVDSYLAMDAGRTLLEEGVPAAEVWPQLPPPTDNAWLTSRRDRLLLELARRAERAGDRALALTALAGSGHPDARLKQLRLLERMRRYDQAWALACDRQRQPVTDRQRQGLARIMKRLAGKVGERAPTVPALTPAREWRLSLERPEPGPIEVAVASALSTEDAPVVYVENALIPGLFGLLCWPVIFQPMPGAFFHPFHAGPADLTRADFVSRRQRGFEACLAALGDGSYRQRIWTTWRRKAGIANPFVIWPVLTERLLTLALACLPPAHLEVMFRRLLSDIGAHRAGFPDLVRFRPQAGSGQHRYEFIEVKGPGDRLQDHQRHWFDAFARAGIPASVCYVRWSDSDAGA